MDASLYASRRRRNMLAAAASYGATFVGLTWLALISWVCSSGTVLVDSHCVSLSK